MTSPPPLPLDDAGLLPEGSVAFPGQRDVYTVFAQQTDARIDAAAWARHATQFFGSELRLTRPKQYAYPPETDGAHVVLIPRGGVSETRRVFLRPRTDDDLVLAEEAERAAGGGGMSLLAKRCKGVVLVELALPQDKVALRIAAIVASVVLGPILAPDRPDLFGVKTARTKLEA